ncbi:hypothetical protein U1Q18_032783, partial [Sarracenia purpurea var. burkii]
MKNASFDKESVPLVHAKLRSLNTELKEFCHRPLFNSARIASLEAQIQMMKMISPIKKEIVDERQSSIKAEIGKEKNKAIFGRKIKEAVILEDEITTQYSKVQTPPSVGIRDKEETVSGADDEEDSEVEEEGTKDVPRTYEEGIEQGIKSDEEGNEMHHLSLDVDKVMTPDKEPVGRPKPCTEDQSRNSGVYQTQATTGVPILDPAPQMFDGMPVRRMVTGSVVEGANVAHSHPKGRGGVQKWADIVSSSKEYLASK